MVTARELLGFVICLSFVCSIQCSIAIQVNTNATVTTLPDKYLSMSIDSSQLVGSHFWSSNPQPFNFSRPRLINMAKALAPAVLRVGGTDGDKVSEEFRCFVCIY